MKNFNLLQNDILRIDEKINISVNVDEVSFPFFFSEEYSQSFKVNIFYERFVIEFAKSCDVIDKTR